MKKAFDFLFSGMFMLGLLLLLIAAMAGATFIENDFGPNIARLWVYNAWWFEGLMLLLCVNLLGRSIKQKLYRKQKLSIFLFHLAWVVMIFGAGITRYFGYEGSMHIREGEASSMIKSNQKMLAISLNGEAIAQVDLAADLETLNNFKKTLSHHKQDITVERTQVYANAYKKAVPDEKGEPVIGFVISGKDIRGFNYITKNEVKHFGALKVSFNDHIHGDLNFHYVNDSLFLSSPAVIFANAMGNKSEQSISNDITPFKTKVLYRINDYNVVLQEFQPKAKMIPQPTDLKSHMRSMKAMDFKVSINESVSNITLWENQWNDVPATGFIKHDEIGIFYGNKTIELPFYIYLKKFEIERYPGSSSPSSFSSYVTLQQAGKEDVPFHIYMNNILKHEGFRFYQSSYDQDEKGTILSVNHDAWGTGITYVGYVLLILGIILSMFNKHSFFRKTKLPKKFVPAIFLFLFTLSHGLVQGQEHHSHTHLSPVSKKHSEKFGELLIQNPKGRTEPVYTFASELIRKVSRSENMHNLTPIQLFMEMNMDPATWIEMPLIRITNKELQEYLGLGSKYAAYTSFMSDQQGYLLQNRVQEAFATPPAQRSKFDKAVIKADERVNICYGVFSGRYLKIFPVPGVQDSLTWYTAKEAAMFATSEDDSLFLSNILPFYFTELSQARNSGDYAAADNYLQGLINFQQKNAGYRLPSKTKRLIEISYFKYNPFKKLFPFYSAVGIILLILQIIYVVRGLKVPKLINSSFLYLILLAFVFHTAGIIARWYISGHAPMSNGYESMIFISWVTIVAGFIYGRHSDFTLPATAVLSGLTLMVANLSFMDPEITNLVPVLQSYWLTIHVSVITASYGFLALGTLLGIINFILIILRTSKNTYRIIQSIHSLTLINHKTLIAGLYLLTIGTFLGAVWANESWGRYWGWDPKETWALISILVYTIVTHARLIPGLKGVYFFNLLSIFGFASILMTYFGVNYYLSGLHSYAGGDPVPVPSFVYYTLACIVLLSAVAYFRSQNLRNTDE